MASLTPDALAVVCCIWLFAPPNRLLITELNVLAMEMSEATMLLSIFTSGARIFVRVCPMMLINSCHCMDRMRVWLAQLSEVRAKSPWASASWFRTKL